MKKKRDFKSKKAEVRRKRIGWVIWLCILVLSAYIVPYLFLSDVNRVNGAFLFWTLFAVTAIITTFKIISPWRD